MKRIITLLASIVLATSLLAAPCLASEPEDVSATSICITDIEQSESSEQPDHLGESDTQPCDTFLGNGDVV